MQKQMPPDFVQEKLIFFKNPQIAGPQSPFWALKMRISEPKFEHASKNPLE